MINFSLVDVKNITSNIPRSNFLEADLANLADRIIETGGIIRPLVVTVTGAENYVVVDGHFEYYAAVKAKEKNPRQCEMVNAFVISPKHEDIVLQQVAIFRKFESNDNSAITTSIEADISKSSSYNNDFKLLENQINELRLEIGREKQERQKLDDSFNQIESQIPKHISPLDAFNNLSLLELTFRLKTANFNDKKAIQVVESIEKERRNKKFESLKDVVERVTIANGKKRVKGISGDKMVDIVDTWSRVLFT